MKWLAILAVAGSAFSSHAQTFEIKGYALGAPMADCPDGTLKRGGRPPEIDCYLGPTTLANAPVGSVTVTLFEGKISSVLFILSNRGQYSNGEVRDALSEKFGPPTRAKAHVNEYHWLRPGQHMALDGWKGNLLIYNVDDYEKIKKARQQTNRKDL